MKESRLFGILYYLLDSGNATAPELAEKFEVSVRTIYRDIDALSENGIPVYCERGKGGGIFLLSDFVLRGAILSAEEKDEILSAVNSLDIAKDGKSLSLKKLSALFKRNSDDWLQVNFSPWSSETHGFDRDKFETLKSAIIDMRCVKIGYAASDGDITERIIEPIKLVYRSRAWYLYAYCREKRGFRIFKLNRIFNFELLSDRFDKKQFPTDSDDNDEIEYICVTLDFKPELAYRVYDEFDPSLITRRDNGDITVTAKIPHDSWLTGFLLSLGTGVEIVSPDSVKREVYQVAKNICEKYGT